jgi:hypothetical protein
MIKRAFWPFLKDKNMAKKKKSNPVLPVAVFLIVASLAAAGVFAYLYFNQTKVLEESAKKLSETKSQQDQLLSNVSELQSRLALTEDEKRQVEALGKDLRNSSLKLVSELCGVDNCLLSSSRDKVFGLATVKAYYKRLEELNVAGELEYCPALVLVEGDDAFMKKLRDEGDGFCSIEGDDSIVMPVGYGDLSATDRNSIRASTAANPIVVKVFSHELAEGVGLEGADLGACFSPWLVLEVE